MILLSNISENNVDIESHLKQYESCKRITLRVNDLANPIYICGSFCIHIYNDDVPSFTFPSRQGLTLNRVSTCRRLVQG